MACTGFSKKRCKTQSNTRTLIVCSPSVHQSIFITRSVQERIGKQQQQGNHQAIDGHGLDHRQPDKQGARNRIGRIRLPRQRIHCRSNCPAFCQRRADSAKGDGDNGADDTDELNPNNAIHVASLISEPRSSSPTAAPMNTNVSMEKMYACMIPTNISRAMNGIGTNSPASETTMPITNAPLIMFPNRRSINEKVRVKASTRFNGTIIQVGSANDLR